MTNEKELKPCKVKKLLNDEVVTGMLNPDGTFTDIEIVGTPEYEIPSDDKVGVQIEDIGKPRGVGYKTIWVKDVLEEEKEDNSIAVYKKAWDSDWVYFKVGYFSNGSVILDLPKRQETTSYYDPLNKDKYNDELRHKGYPKIVQKFSPIWYRDDKDIKVSFVPSNDVYEIINSNKNESLGYLTHEGKVIYWNQYRS